jgi:aminoglycoside phosphotransferase family enzyme
LSGAAPKETHVSAIFIGDDTVWKLKKAVRLPFLDFTNVEARRHFLQQQLNRLSAPAMYRDVVAVLRRPHGMLDEHGPTGRGAYRLGTANGTVPEHFLDIVAARGGLTPKVQDALGDCVARYHANLPPVVGWDSLGALLRTAEGNARSAAAAGLP